MGLKSKEIVDGTFAKAAMDEPLFVLRAQDKTSPALVRRWAEQFRSHHVKAGTEGRSLAKAIVKYTEALEVADAMDRWAIKKQPD